MSFRTNKALAAFNVSLSVIFTALLIGVTSRSTGDAALVQKLIGLIIADLFFTSTATHTILCILTDKKPGECFED